MMLSKIGAFKASNISNSSNTTTNTTNSTNATDYVSFTTCNTTVPQFVVLRANFIGHDLNLEGYTTYKGNMINSVIVTEKYSRGLSRSP